jgi:hypothetical protein
VKTLSSRRKEAKIAQGETLGKRSAQQFPPRRGGVKHILDGEVQRSTERRFDLPLRGEFFSLYNLPRVALRFTLGYFRLLPTGAFPFAVPAIELDETGAQPSQARIIRATRASISSSSRNSPRAI